MLTRTDARPRPGQIYGVSGDVNFLGSTNDRRWFVVKADGQQYDAVSTSARTAVDEAMARHPAARGVTVMARR